MDHLSDDELCKILGILTVQQVPAADATCRRWHTVARSNALWKKMLLAHYPAASKLPSNDCRSLFRSMKLQLRPPELLPVPLDDVVILFEMHRLNGERISLAWASANFDETAFSEPQEVRLDRKPNPHISFGFGTHLCLGAPHARLILRTLLKLCCERVKSIIILKAEERVEHEAKFDRTLGYDALTVKLTPL